MPPRRVFSTEKSRAMSRARSASQQRRRRGSRIDQRADGHIAADAGERVEIADFHDSSCGRISAAVPRSDASTRCETGVSAILISTTRAPLDFASSASPAAGYTTADVPMIKNKSALCAASSAARPHVSRQRFAEPDHPRPFNPSARAARRQFGNFRAPVFTLTATDHATHRPDIAVDFQHTSASGAIVQAVDVLSDQSKFRNAPREFCQRPMPRVRLRARDHAASPVIPLPDQLRVPLESFGRRQILRAILAPQSARAPKRRNPALSRNPGAGKQPRSTREDSSHSRIRSIPHYYCRSGDAPRILGGRASRGVSTRHARVHAPR